MASGYGSFSNQIKLLMSFMSDETCPYPYITLLIHNLEGAGLSSDQVQSAIAQLSTHPKIYLVASCDHLNTPMLWSHSKIAQFNFAWHDITTYTPYLIETSFENSLISAVEKGSEVYSSNGARFVLRSLTSNARNVFKCLAAHQIAYMKEILSVEADVVCQSDAGLSYDALYTKCTGKFYVSDRLPFTTMMTEFIDHRVMIQVRDSEGDLVYIPMSTDMLEELVAEVDTL